MGDGEADCLPVTHYAFFASILFRSRFGARRQSLKCALADVANFAAGDSGQSPSRMHMEQQTTAGPTDDFTPTGRTAVKRLPRRGHYERDARKAATPTDG